MAFREHSFAALARSQVPGILAEALGIGPSISLHAKDARRDQPFDFTVKVEGRTLLMEVLGRAELAPILHRWESLRKAGARNQTPVVVVPFMPDSVRELCGQLRINWLDLSGNASIHAPGFHLRSKGNTNRYARRGRPASAFERRSSRIARALLQHPGRSWSLRECARETGLSDGHASRVLAKLVEDYLVVRDEHRRYRVRDPALLLEAWRESADFSRHEILRGHVPARSGEELLRLSGKLHMVQIEHAATGLGAAWLYDHFAMFRLVTFYVSKWPSPAQYGYLNFREDPVGANVWFALPNDGGVFSGQRRVDGVPCVHPVQVYVDLKDHPERSSEASEHLRKNPLLLGDARAI